MKAWVLRKSAPIEEGPLELVEVPTPHPGPNQVRVRVTACGICRTDLHIAEGELPAGKDSLILGHEIVGAVDRVGKGVSRVLVGEKVGVTWLGRTCGKCKHCVEGRENYCAGFQATGRDLDGGFAEYVVAHELTHRKYPNHSKEFWAFVSRYPKAERARGFILGIAFQLGEDAEEWL